MATNILDVLSSPQPAVVAGEGASKPWRGRRCKHKMRVYWLSKLQPGRRLFFECGDCLRDSRWEEPVPEADSQGDFEFEEEVPNKPKPSFVEDMRARGFTDVDVVADFRSSVGADFYDDIRFLLERISRLPASTFPPEHPPLNPPPPEVFLFERNLQDLRAEAGGLSFGNRGFCYRVRGKTEWCFEKNWNKHVQPFETQEEVLCDCTDKSKCKHERFSKRMHKWLFKNQTNEAPAIVSGNYNADQSQGESESLAEFIQEPKFGEPWFGDEQFALWLGIMMPRGYPKLDVYQCGSKKNAEGIQIPDNLALPRNLYEPLPPWRGECPVTLERSTKKLRFAESCIDDEDREEEDREEEVFENMDAEDEEGVEDFDEGVEKEKEKNPKITLGFFEPITKDQAREAELLLRKAETWKPELHKRYAHFYEGYFKYYRQFEGGVFNSVLTSETSGAEIPLVDPWGEAVKNTCGHLDLEETVDGWYIKYQVNPKSTPRIHLIQASTPIDFDKDEDLQYVNPETDEYDIQFGLPEIYAQIRANVAGMRVVSKKTATVASNMRGIMKEGEIRYIRFTQSDIHGLSWEVS